MNKAFMGIDPGVSGGIALITSSKSKAVAMPKTEADIFEAISSLIAETALPVFCALEKVHAMPKQGVSSTFTFGKNYGFLRASLIALKIPFDDVPPQRWQKALSCLSKGNKNVTKQKAQQLFPQLKITHAIADALLLAEYAKRSYQ